METKKKATVKPSYLQLKVEYNKLFKEISQINCNRVTLEKQVADLKSQIKGCVDEFVEVRNSNIKLRELNSTLSDNAVHFQSERAELALALVEISNCKDLDLVKEIARIALNGVHSVVKLKDTVPF